MTENISWFAEPGATTTPAGDPTSSEQAWIARFRGAVLGGAIGDALGAGIRHQPVPEIQRRFGPQGVIDYVPVFGRRGAATEITQLAVFTLEALLRAKAMAEVAPNQAIRANYLSWLYTQGVPWEFAMSGYGQSPSEPGSSGPAGWLLKHSELFSTRNPAGSAMHALGMLATQPPQSSTNPFPAFPPLEMPTTECVAWTAPVMAWSSDESIVCAVAYRAANLLTGDYQTRAAAALHSDVLSQLLRGVRLWDAVRSWEVNRAYLEYATAPDVVLRAVYAAMLSSSGGRRAQPAALDIEFDTARAPGELGIALASAAATDTFADAVLMAINHSGDSSVAGALAGQLAGAIHGIESIPRHWLDELELGHLLETLCADAAEAFAPPPPAPPPEWAKRYVNDVRVFSGPLELPRSAQLGENTVEGSAVGEPYMVISDRVEQERVEAPALGVPVGEESDGEMPGLPAAEVVETGTGASDWAGITVGSSTEDWMEGFVSTEHSPGPTTEEPVSAAESAGEQGPGGGQESVAGEADEEHEPAAFDVSEPAAGETPVETDVPEPLGSFPSAEVVESTGTSPADAPRMAGLVEVSFTELARDGSGPAGADHAEREAAESVALKPSLSGGHAKVEESSVVVPSLTERVLGCFLGGGLGDALGSELEYASAEEIAQRFGPEGPGGLGQVHGLSGAISDDTQLTLFTAEGLIRGSVAYRRFGVADPLPEVQLAYQRWLHTQGVGWELAAGAFRSKYPAPDGWLIGVPGLFDERWPSKTVYQALLRFGQGHPAGSFTEKINESKGSGGVMRAAPVALYSADPAVVFELAAEIAALTHSHPSGYLSAGALAVIVQQALLGQGLDDGVWLALQVLETWEGYEETSALLKAAVELAAQGETTPQQIEDNLGGGWVGEEALAIAVCAALVGGDDVGLALRVAVRHSGDSDSAGSICGNIVGALAGIGRLPVDWLAELALRDIIQQVALDCVAEFGVGEFLPGVEHGEHGRPTDDDWQERYPVRPLWSDNGVDGPRDPHIRVPIVTAPDTSGHLGTNERGETEGDQEPTGPEESQGPHGLVVQDGPANTRAHDGEGAEVRWNSASLDERARAGSAWTSQEEQVGAGSAEEGFGTAERHSPKPAPRRLNGALTDQHDS